MDGHCEYQTCRGGGGAFQRRMKRGRPSEAVIKDREENDADTRADNEPENGGLPSSMADDTGLITVARLYTP